MSDTELDWRSELRRTWASIGNADQQRQGITAIVVTRSSDDRSIRVGVDSLGRRCLLVVVTESDCPDPPLVDSALSLGIEPLVFGDDTGRQIVVRCSRPDLFDLFDELLAGLLVDVSASPRPATTVAAAVNRWRELLRARSALGLHPLQEMGLFGELRVFEIILEALGPQSIDIWRGPLNEPQDFLLADRFIEVKSCGPAQLTVTVHGLEQLSLQNGLPGCLAILELFETPMGRSIEDLTISLENLGVAPELLRDRLLEFGWAPEQQPRRWDVGEIVAAHVADVPRLTPESMVAGVPHGVSRVEYQLDVGVVRLKGRVGVSALSEMLMVTP